MKIAADVVLDTPRLELARFRAAHRALLDTPDIARLLPVPTPISEEMAAAVFDQILALPPERLGFREIGRQVRHCLLDGVWVDWVTMELFAEDWRA